MSDVELSPLAAEGLGVLRALYQLYQYDFSEFTLEDVGGDGMFVNDGLDRYVTDAAYGSYLMRVDGKIAGFAVVHRCEAVDARDAFTDIVQFFVMRKYRRQRIGEAAAVRLFDAHPGGWQIRERHDNVAAQAFWRAIIERYTDGDFEDDPGAGAGAVERDARQFFVSGT